VLRNGLFIQKVISHHLALRPWRQLNKTLGPKAERKQQLGAKRGNARKDFARVLPTRLRLLVFAVQHPSEKNFVQRMIINDLTPPCHRQVSNQVQSSLAVGLGNQFLALLHNSR